MFSTDDGQTWQPLQLNLPTVAVHDLVVKDDDLVRRHARPVDLDPRRPAADPRVHDAKIAAEPLHLFAPADGDAVALRVEQLGHARRLLEPAARRGRSTTR